MSYIAVSLKAIEVQGPALSRALNLELALVVGRLNLLWHRCWSMKTDKVGALELRGFFPEPDAGPLLEAYGFLAKDAEGWRVRGADRYLRLREQRTAAGKARSSSAGRSAGKFTSKTPASNQRSASGQPALTPSTEHRAPNTEQKTPAPPDPRHRPLVAALCSVWKQRHPDEYPFGPRDAKVVKNLLALAEPDAIEAAWERALDHQGFPSICSLPDFERHFPRFTTDHRGKISDVGTGFVNSVTEGF